MDYQVSDEQVLDMLLHNSNYIELGLEPVKLFLSGMKKQKNHKCSRMKNNREE